jgi:alkaline phosphatase
MALRYTKYLFSDPTDSQKHEFVADEIEDGLGIFDATASLYQYADMMSRRSQTGWSTHGHSAADVNIYSSDPKAAMALVGNHENTEVGEFLRDYLDVDVEAVTKELREKGTNLKVLNSEGEQVSWMGKIADEGQRLDGQNHLASYGGDFKKRHLLHGRGCDCGH